MKDNDYCPYCGQIVDVTSVRGMYSLALREAYKISRETEIEHVLEKCKIKFEQPKKSIWLKILEKCKVRFK